ncbi:MAG: hypothetical protein ACP5NX_03775 [Candidatus Bilamarchaeaceae archaeon]
MNPADAKSDLMSVVEELKRAETDADRKKADAEKEAESIIKRAKEEASNIIMKSRDDAVALKNDIIHSGKTETDKEVKKIVDKARADGKALRAKKLKKEDVAELAKHILQE